MTWWKSFWFLSCVVLPALVLVLAIGSRTASGLLSCLHPSRGVLAVSAPSVDVGAYYFDGWAGPPSDFHFAGLSSGPFDTREPLYGWSDRPLETMRTQLGWARADGIRFFVFDWYHPSKSTRDPNLDHALLNYGALRSHDGVAFALDYINTNSSGDNFVVPATDWTPTISAWSRYLSRPDYARVAGMPLFVIYDAIGLRQQLGGSARVAALLEDLREGARERGSPGVFVAAGLGNHIDPSASTIAQLAREGFDAVTQYAYPTAAGPAATSHSYPALISRVSAIWSRIGAHGGLPLLPGVMAGWDPRPWRERTDGVLIWLRRSPRMFATFVRDALRYSRDHPLTRPSVGRSATILITAWNELGEGDYIVPTVGSCDRYGQALAAAVGERSSTGR